MSLPIIAITMGDPAGVGPELALQLLRESPSDLGCIPVVFGDHQVLLEVSKQLGIMTDFSTVELHEWKNRTTSKLPSVVNLNSIRIDDFTPGKINPATGKASYDYVTTAIEECLAGRIDGITVDRDGTITGTFTNGLTRTLAQVALGTFRNLEGLTPMGDTAWQESAKSA